MNRLGNIQGIMTAQFIKEPLVTYRKTFPFLKDQDIFKIEGVEK